MFLHLSVILSKGKSMSRGSLSMGCLCLGGSMSRGLCTGVFFQVGLCQVSDWLWRGPLTNQKHSRSTQGCEGNVQGHWGTQGMQGAHRVFIGVYRSMQRAYRGYFMGTYGHVGGTQGHIGNTYGVHRMCRGCVEHVGCIGACRRHIEVMQGTQGAQIDLVSDNREFEV